MGIKKLTILGKSDATITMILDNLESNNQFPHIEIINNFNLPEEYPFFNPKFTTTIEDTIKESDHYFLGVNKSINKYLTYNNFKLDMNMFINIIHKSSQISTTVKFGYGCLINSLVSIAAYSNIGNFVSINRNSSIGHHTNIGDFVTIQPGTNIAGLVNIGERTLVGMGVNIIDGVNIGKNSVIGFGSLVTKDIPDNVIAYGSPCKIIKDNE